MDTFEPDVGIATLDLLERLGCTVDYPFDQTCCGQPMVNTGCHKEAAATEALFVENFAGYEYIVCPSGSCTHQVRANLTAIEQTETVQRVRAIMNARIDGGCRTPSRRTEKITTSEIENN